MEYSDFINDLKPLREEADSLFDLTGMHQDAPFRKWRSNVTFLKDAIEKQGYSIQCAIANRYFDHPSSHPGLKKEKRLGCYNRDLQDTINELDLLIKHFEEYGDPQTHRVNNPTIMVEKQEGLDAGNVRTNTKSLTLFTLIEKFIPSTRSKVFATLTVAVTTGVYFWSKELPSSWLPASDAETFLLRIVVTLAIALIGVVATLISVIADHSISPSESQASKDDAVGARQKAIDELAEDLSWAIHNLLNRKVSFSGDLSKWEKDYKSWCHRVSDKLKNRKFFTKAQKLHFDRLGLVPKTNFQGSYNSHHEKLISQLSLKFDRLRDIINK